MKESFKAPLLGYMAKQLSLDYMKKNICLLTLYLAPQQLKRVQVYPIRYCGRPRSPCTWASGSTCGKYILHGSLPSHALSCVLIFLFNFFYFYLKTLCQKIYFQSLYLKTFCFNFFVPKFFLYKNFARQLFFPN